MNHTLPSSWALSTLDEVADIVLGQSPPSSSYNDTGDGLPFFQGKAEFGEMYPTPVKWCSKPKKVAEDRAVLLSVRAPVGPTNLSRARCCVGRGLAALHSEEGMHRRYLLYALRCDEARLAKSGKGTTFKAVTGSQVRDFQIPVAPSPEQQRIADKIDELFSDLDAGVKALERVERNLERYRASVFKSAVEGRLTADWRKVHPDVEPAAELLKRILLERRKRWEEGQLAKYKAAGEVPPKGWQTNYKEPKPPDTSDLPSLPKGWCWATVEQVGDVKLGRQRAPKYHQGEHMRPYLRVANVYEDRIDTSDVLSMEFSPTEARTFALLFGDILLNEGQSEELVGRPAMYRNDLPGACFQNTLIRFRAYNGVRPEYALILFRAYLRNGRFRKSARITTNIAHLGAERFARIEFPLPPSDEQAASVDVAAACESQILDAEAKTVVAAGRAAGLRHGILRRAFAGRLVPQDPNDEPASRLLDRIRAARAAAKEPRRRQNAC